MDKKNKSKPDMYKQFKQDDLAHPFRSKDNKNQGKEDWRSLTSADKTSASENAYNESAYTQDVAIQESQEHEQRLFEKISRKKTYPQRCKRGNCPNFDEE